MHGEFAAEAHEDSDDKPGREADQDAAQVAHASLSSAKELKKASAHHVGARGGLVKKPGIQHFKSQKQQAQAHSSADEVGGSPFHSLGDKKCRDGAQQADSCNE